MVAMGDSDHLLNLLDAGDADDNRNWGRRVAIGLGDHRASPPVAGPVQDIMTGGEHLVSYATQLVNNAFTHSDRVTLQAVPAALDLTLCGPARWRVDADKIIAAVITTLNRFFTDHSALPIRMDFSCLTAAR